LGGNYTIRQEFKDINAKEKMADGNKTFDQKEVNEYLDTLKQHIKDIAESDSSYANKRNRISIYIRELKSAPTPLAKTTDSIKANIKYLVRPMLNNFMEEDGTFNKRGWKEFVRGIKKDLFTVAQHHRKKYVTGKSRRHWKRSIKERKLMGYARRRADKSEDQTFQGSKRGVGRTSAVTFRDQLT